MPQSRSSLVRRIWSVLSQMLRLTPKTRLARPVDGESVAATATLETFEADDASRCASLSRGIRRQLAVTAARYVRTYEGGKRLPRRVAPCQTASRLPRRASTSVRRPKVADRVAKPSPIKRHVWLEARPTVKAAMTASAAANIVRLGTVHKATTPMKTPPRALRLAA
jgi:hypothetical protein